MTTYADPRHTMLTLVKGGTVTIEPVQVAVRDHTKITSPWHADGVLLDDQTSADELLLCDLVDIDLPTGRVSLTIKGEETLTELTGVFERGFQVGSVIILRTTTGNTHNVVADPRDSIAITGIACNPSKLPKRYTLELSPISHGAVCNRCNGVNLNGGRSHWG